MEPKITIKIEKINFEGYYFYEPKIDLNTYDNIDDNNDLKDNICGICQLNVHVPSFENTSENKNIVYEPLLILGKCGHIFHNDCLQKWIKAGNTICPIDKVLWYTDHIIDSTTNLSLLNNKNKFKKL